MFGYSTLFHNGTPWFWYFCRMIILADAGSLVTKFWPYPILVVLQAHKAREIHDDHLANAENEAVCSTPSEVCQL